MTKKELNFIADYYNNKLSVGINTPDLTNKCYKLITGTDLALRGYNQKKLTITRFMMTRYHYLMAEFKAKEAESAIILTKMKDNTETNYSGRKIELNDDTAASLTNEGQSHQESLAHDDLGNAKQNTQVTEKESLNTDLNTLPKNGESETKEVSDNKPKRKQRSTNGRKRKTGKS